ncbi:GAF domain-containing protein [Chitinophaga vietnamensis]|uniref:GAF domain-containing protein n=1 Tax=Chitinophaga vietnamensis TaxID=2593957 RepID=UPI0011773B6C|nr:GAF domain-containing protein [Chitinophaga vietnamensis]
MKLLTAHQDLFKDEQLISTRISFAPFIRFLKDKIRQNHDGRATYYKYIIDKFEENPALLQPLPEDADLEPYREYLDMVTAAIFPVTIDSKKDIYGISIPYKFAIFYYSEMFQHLFTENGTMLAAVPRGVSLAKVKKDKKMWLYKLILERIYHFPMGYQNEIIHTIEAPDGLRRHVKVNIDARFVDVKVNNDVPATLDYNQFCTKQVTMERLEEFIPLDKFSLEGFAIWTVEDVTQAEALNTVKGLVMNMQSSNELESYRTLERLIPAVLGIFDITAHVVPFPEVNGKPVLEEQFAISDPMLGVGNKKQQQTLFAQVQEHLSKHRMPLIIPEVSEDSIAAYPFLKFLPLKKVRSFILFPITHKNEILGVLELASSRPNALSERPLWQLQNIYPLLVLMLNRSIGILESRINEVIKEQFTALQPAVEWKFVDAAWKYLLTPETERKDIGNISFDEVYPLYGAVDIRNSSVEQGNAIREDLQEQLQLIGETLQAIAKEVPLPLLEELQFKTQDLLNNLSHNLQAGEDVKVNDFMDQEVQPVLEHLCESNDKLQPVLQNYFSKVDKSEGHVFHHRREYEESLAQVNAAISQYLEKERQYIQQSFPCYFEKYRTDGIEYTIYIGQSIAQEKKFDSLYLRNLRLWQLSSMANIARITHKLSPKLKIPLMTTQMILMHSAPITISFRNDERRFDVEGAYNIRYEIIKKRIDKVHVKDTGERLTQPGTVAIVYSNVREMEEYQKYITFLQSKNILKPEVEMLDLEELQGVSGLKALRVTVNLEQE